MTEKEILQQQETNGQKSFYLIAVGMFYHAYGCGAFALARTTGYRVLSKHRKHGNILTCGFPANQLDTVLQRLREAGGVVEQVGEKTFLFRHNGLLHFFSTAVRRYLQAANAAKIDKWVNG